MIEREAKQKWPEWFNDAKPDGGVWDSGYDWNTVKVSQNATQTGEWHSYKKYLETLWRNLNP